MPTKPKKQLIAVEEADFIAMLRAIPTRFEDVVHTVGTWCFAAIACLLLFSSPVALPWPSVLFLSAYLSGFLLSRFLRHQRQRMRLVHEALPPERAD